MTALLALNSDDVRKLALFALVVVALFLVMRRLSGAAPETASQDFAAASPAFAASVEPQPVASAEVDSSFLEAPEIAPVQLRKFYFANTSTGAGPPDPDVFLDELTLELYDPGDGHAWQLSYVLATPLGLQRELDEKRWESMYVPEVLVFRRYDLYQMRKTVLERVRDSSEVVPKGEQQQGLPLG